MPKPTKLRNRYYVRMPVTASDGRTKYTWITLGTDNLAIAQERLLEVMSYAELIKSGKTVDFWWRSGSQNAVNTITLDDMIEKYLKWASKQHLKHSTLEVYKTALEKHLIKALGKKFRIENISRKDLEKFRQYFSTDLSLHTVKKNERAVHTFLNWLKDEGVIDNVPKLRPLRIPRQQPVYVSEKELELIQAQTTPFMSKIFEMYFETGMRLSEGFMGDFRGSYLVIDEAKNGQFREIPLKPEYIELIQEMRDKEWTPKHYSRMFWKACKDAGVVGKKFHSLRHSFAIRTIIRTGGDIYITAKLMGHSNITTTQIYTTAFLSRLQADFPSLVKESSSLIPFKSAINY
jgi:site-specific recombinase XerD